MQIKIRAILFILLSLFMMGGCRELKYKGTEKEQTEQSPEPSIHIAGQEIPLSTQKVKLLLRRMNLTHWSSLYA